MAEDKRIVPVILSGGAGTRLWPLSSPARPKQFLALVGERTMLQETALRASDPALFEPPLVIGSAEHAPLLAAQLAGIGASPSALILEPSARSTAPPRSCRPCRRAGPIALVMPSDHVGPTGPPRRRSRSRPTLAEQDWLVTFGIRPPMPNRLAISAAAKPSAPESRVDRFVEKPDAATAQAISMKVVRLERGIFMFRAGRYLGAATLRAAIFRSGSARWTGRGRRIPTSAPIPTASPPLRPSRSLCGDGEGRSWSPSSGRDGWSDIAAGCAPEVSEADARGNVAKAPSPSSIATIAWSTRRGREVVALGVRDLIVVVAEDAVLVLPRGQSQR